MPYRVLNLRLNEHRLRLPAGMHCRESKLTSAAQSVTLLDLREHLRDLIVKLLYFGDAFVLFFSLGRGTLLLPRPGEGEQQLPCGLIYLQRVAVSEQQSCVLRIPHTAQCTLLSPHYRLVSLFYLFPFSLSAPAAGCLTMESMHI